MLPITTYKSWSFLLMNNFRGVHFFHSFSSVTFTQKKERLKGEPTVLKSAWSQQLLETSIVYLLCTLQPSRWNFLAFIKQKEKLKDRDICCSLCYCCCFFFKIVSWSFLKSYVVVGIIILPYCEQMSVSR